MPYIDAHLFEKKGVKQTLILILDEGDGILESIKAGMVEHNLNDVKLESIEGTISEAVINFFERNSFKSAVIRDKKVMIASGGFKLSYGELFGSMKVVTDEKPPVHGTLVRGKAKQDFKVVLSFIELVDK